MKRTHKLNNPAVCSLLFLIVLFPWADLKSQVTNGVFDPSKARNRELANELQQIEVNILSANEFNRTVGTPDHPGGVLAPPASNSATPSANIPTFTVHQSGPPPRKLSRSVAERSHSHAEIPSFDITAPVLETAQVDNSERVLNPDYDLPQFSEPVRNSPLAMIGRAFAPGPHGKINEKSNAIPVFNFIMRALSQIPQAGVGRPVDSNNGEINFSSPVPTFEPNVEIGNTNRRISGFGNNDPLDALFRAFAPKRQVREASQSQDLGLPVFDSAESFSSAVPVFESVEPADIPQQALPTPVRTSQFGNNDPLDALLQAFAQSGRQANSNQSTELPQ